MESWKGWGLPLLWAVNMVARPPGVSETASTCSASLPESGGQVGVAFLGSCWFQSRGNGAEVLIMASGPSTMLLSIKRLTLCSSFGDQYSVCGCDPGGPENELRILNTPTCSWNYFPLLLLSYYKKNKNYSESMFNVDHTLSLPF